MDKQQNKNLMKQASVSLKNTLEYVAEVLEIVQAKYPSFKIENMEKTLEYWSAALSSLTAEQWRMGCSKLLETTDKYAPNANTFKVWAFGLHEVNDAFYFAEKKTYLTPAIYHAAQQSDMNNANLRITSSQRKEKFATAYKNICERIMLGEKLEQLENNTAKVTINNSSSGYRSWLSRKYGEKAAEQYDENCKLPTEQVILKCKSVVANSNPAGQF